MQAWAHTSYLTQLCRCTCAPASSSRYVCNGRFCSPRAYVGGFAAPMTYQHPQPAHHVHPARRSKQWRRKLISACTLSQLESSASSMMDLWNKLKKEGCINQITPHWRSKRIIASAPDDCTCLPPAKAKSMTEHTSNSSSSKL